MRDLAIVTLALGLVAACSGSHTAPAAPAAPATDPDPPAGPAARAPYTEFQLDDRGALVLPGPIVFATGSAELDEAASADALWYVHDYLQAKDHVTLARIEGHSDTAGDDALMMTGDRALAVGRWLVAHGIGCERLVAAAFGDTKPIADGSTAEGRARNRRVEVTNAALRGIAIGGLPTDGGAPAAAPVCD